jgi:hypothetical protein
VSALSHSKPPKTSALRARSEHPEPRNLLSKTPIPSKLPPPTHQPSAGAIPKRRALPGVPYDLFEDRKKGADAARLRAFVEAHLPHAIVVGVAGPDALTLRDDVEAVLGKILEDNPRAFTSMESGGVTVVPADEAVASAWAASAAAAAELPGSPDVVRRAVALARGALDPLAVLAALAGAGREALALPLHPLQAELPDDERAAMIESVLVTAVAQAGVDVNAAAAAPWLAPALALVPGLGPRKAGALLRAAARAGGALPSRAAAAAALGPTVARNAVPFLRVRPPRRGAGANAEAEPLDETRVHPESYRHARAMAVSAFEGQDADLAVANALARPSEVALLDLAFYDAHVAAEAGAEAAGDDAEAEALYGASAAAQIVAAAAGGSRLATLIDAAFEFAAPFGELRAEPGPLTEEELFWLSLGGETRESLRPGRRVEARVRYVGRDLVRCVLPDLGGVEAVIRAGEVSSAAVRTVEADAAAAADAAAEAAARGDEPRFVEPGPLPECSHYFKVRVWWLGWLGGCWDAVLAGCHFHPYVFINSLPISQLRSALNPGPQNSPPSTPPTLTARQVGDTVTAVVVGLDARAREVALSTASVRLNAWRLWEFEYLQGRDRDFYVPTEEEVAAAEREKLRAAARAAPPPRPIRHALFAPLSLAEAAERVVAAPVGAALLRGAARRGPRRATLALTVHLPGAPDPARPAAGGVWHLDVRERGPPRANGALAPPLEITPVPAGGDSKPRDPHSYDDLDELVARFVDPLAGGLRALGAHRKFRHGAYDEVRARQAPSSYSRFLNHHSPLTTCPPARPKQVRAQLDGEAAAAPAVVPYALAADFSRPGAFYLAFRHPKYGRAQREFFVPVPEGFYFRREVHPTVDHLVAAFKRAPLAGAPADAGAPPRPAVAQQAAAAAAYAQAPQALGTGYGAYTPAAGAPGYGYAAQAPAAAAYAYAGEAYGTAPAAGGYYGGGGAPAAAAAAAAFMGGEQAQWEAAQYGGGGGGVGTGYGAPPPPGGWGAPPPPAAQQQYGGGGAYGDGHSGRR